MNPLDVFLAYNGENRLNYKNNCFIVMLRGKREREIKSKKHKVFLIRTKKVKNENSIWNSFIKDQMLFPSSLVITFYLHRKYTSFLPWKFAGLLFRHFIFQSWLLMAISSFLFSPEHTHCSQPPMTLAIFTFRHESVSCFLYHNYFDLTKMYVWMKKHFPQHVILKWHDKILLIIYTLIISNRIWSFAQYA